MTKPPTSKEEFHNSLLGEDELGVVLRAHFYIEAELDVLIRVLTPYPNELPRLRYEQKLKLACALGLDKTAFHPLKELGDLRNSFGHQIGAHLTPGKVKDLFNSFSDKDKIIIKYGYNQTNSQVKTRLPAIDKLAPKPLFVILAVTLYQMLVQTVSEVLQSRST